MQRLSVWADSFRKKKSTHAGLEEALIYGRFTSYAIRRLRYFGVQRTAILILHLIEYYLLSEIFSEKQFVSAVILKNFLFLLGTFWWGVLEVFRTSIRQYFLDRNNLLLQVWIGSWVSLARFLAIVALSIGVASLLYNWIRVGGIGFFHFYITVLFFRFSLDLIARTLHSAVYAVRRVFRPIGFVLAIEFLSFGAVLCFWKIWSYWAFPLSSLLSGVLLFALSMNYVRKTYKTLGLPRLYFVKVTKAWGSIRKMTDGSFLLPGLGFVSTALANVLVLGLLLRGAVRGLEQTQLALALFAIFPLIAAVSDWINVFYFDFKRLEAGAFRRFREQFNRFVLKLCFVMGLCGWGIATVILNVLMPTLSTGFYLSLLPLFLARSWLAQWQISQFTEGKYYPLVLAMVPIAIVCALIAFLGLQWMPNELILILALGIVLGPLLASLFKAKGYSKEIIFPGAHLWNWMVALQSIESPVSVGLLQMRGLNASLMNKTHSIIDGLLGARGAAAHFRKHSILWYETLVEGQSKAINASQVVLSLGGKAKSVEIFGPFAEGTTALRALHERAMPEVNNQFAEKISLERLVQLFKTQYPRGILLQITKNVQPIMEIDRRQLGLVLINAVRFIYGKKQLKGLSVDVSAGLSALGIEYLFLLPKDVALEERLKWRREVSSVNFNALMKATS